MNAKIVFLVITISLSNILFGRNVNDNIHYRYCLFENNIVAYKAINSLKGGDKPLVENGSVKLYRCYGDCDTNSSDLEFKVFSYQDLPYTNLKYYDSLTQELRVKFLKGEEISNVFIDNLIIINNKDGFKINLSTSILRSITISNSNINYIQLAGCYINNIYAWGSSFSSFDMSYSFVRENINVTNNSILTFNFYEFLLSSTGIVYQYTRLLRCSINGNYRERFYNVAQFSNNIFGRKYYVDNFTCLSSLTFRIVNFENSIFQSQIHLGRDHWISGMEDSLPFSRKRYGTFTNTIFDGSTFESGLKCNDANIINCSFDKCIFNYYFDFRRTRLYYFGVQSEITKTYFYNIIPGTTQMFVEFDVNDFNIDNLQLPASFLLASQIKFWVPSKNGMTMPSDPLYQSKLDVFFARAINYSHTSYANDRRQMDNLDYYLEVEQKDAEHFYKKSNHPFYWFIDIKYWILKSCFNYGFDGGWNAFFSLILFVVFFGVIY